MSNILFGVIISILSGSFLYFLGLGIKEIKRSLIQEEKKPSESNNDSISMDQILRRIEALENNKLVAIRQMHSPWQMQSYWRDDPFDQILLFDSDSPYVASWPALNKRLPYFAMTKNAEIRGQELENNLKTDLQDSLDDGHSGIPFSIIINNKPYLVSNQNRLTNNYLTQ